MSQHPRFPDAMGPEVRETVADEVDVTLAGFPSKRSLEQAITAYAEQLHGFAPDEIRAGFREARRQATDYAPSPSQVFACVAAAKRAQRGSQSDVWPVYSRPLTPDEIPDWRSELRGPKS